MASGDGGNEIEITVDVDDSASKSMDEIGESAENMGSKVEKVLDDVVEGSNKMSKTYIDANGKMRDSSGKFVAQAKQDAEQEGQTVSQRSNLWSGFLGKFSSGLEGGVSSLFDFGQQVEKAGFQMAASEAAGSIASGGINLLVQAATTAAGVIPILIGAVLALAPALLAVGGAAGAAATGIVGAIVAFGTLKIGLGGVGDAWKAYGQQAAAGGGSSKAAGDQARQAARSVENAEYSLTQAKREATQASKDLTKARQDEKNALIDLSLQLRGQKYAEADAAKAVQEAEEKLAAARAYGADQGIKDAQDELDRANLNFDVQKQKTAELQQQQDKAAKTGVEGSDQVVAAKQRVVQANEQVKRAEEAVSDAQHQATTSGGGAAGAVNAFAAAMKKLAPNAQDFVRELISVSQRFDIIKRQVQEHLFAGLSDALKDLADKWLPKLGPMLDNMADALNSVFKGIGKALGNSDFMSGVMTASKAFADFLKQDAGPALDHILHGLGELAGGSTEPFQEIGGWLLKISDKFDKWITSAAKSGQLKTFMHDAANTLHEIWDIGGNALTVMGKFIGALFNSSKKAGTSTLDSINDTLIKISDWLDDPKNDKKIQDIEGDIIGWAKAFGRVMNTLNDLKGVFSVVFKIFGPLIVAAAHAVTPLNGAISFLIGSFKWISAHAAGIWDGLKSGFKSAVNWLIDKWNSLHFTLPKVSFLGQSFGGESFGVPHIPHMAAGGAGGGWTLTGENGPELLRLPYGSSVSPAANTRHAMAGQGASGGQLTGTLKVAGTNAAERGLIAELLKMLRIEIGTFYGGSAQRALGR